MSTQQVAGRTLAFAGVQPLAQHDGTGAVPWDDDARGDVSKHTKRSISLWFSFFFLRLTKFFFFGGGPRLFGGFLLFVYRIF